MGPNRSQRIPVTEFSCMFSNDNAEQHHSRLEHNALLNSYNRHGIQDEICKFGQVQSLGRHYAVHLPAVSKYILNCPPISRFDARGIVHHNVLHSRDPF